MKTWVHVRNIPTDESVRYDHRIELGVTGGEEDGVDNTDIDGARLYTQPEGESGL